MKIYGILIVLSVVLTVTGCNNTEKNIKKLEEEAEQYKQSKDYSEAVLTYEKILGLSDDKRYQSGYNDLKVVENDVYLVEKTIEELKKLLFNPESLQVNEVIIYRNLMEGDAEWTQVYMDYSAMNKMGGFARDYAFSAFLNSEFIDEGGFYAQFKSNYQSAKKSIEDGEEETYYFDAELLK